MKLRFEDRVRGLTGNANSDRLSRELTHPDLPQPEYEYITEELPDFRENEEEYKEETENKEGVSAEGFGPSLEQLGKTEAEEQAKKELWEKK